jgi:glycosyltransferase involved in cell wall biosynthesis
MNSAAPTLPGVFIAHSSAELYGADRIVLELAAGLIERGHPLELVLPAPGPLHAELAKMGIHAHRRNLGVLRRRYFSLGGLANRACRVLSAAMFIRRVVRERQLAVIHSNTTAVLAGAIAAKSLGVAHVWHVHEITTRPRWFARAMALCVGLFATRAVFVSQATLEHMCALSARVRRRAVVIHNGIDTSRVLLGRAGVLRAECGWTPQTPVVGMIGRINWWKGQGALLGAAERLQAKHPGLRTLMVGGVYDQDDSVRRQLLADIEARGLQQQVIVQDFRADVGNVLADLDVFVLPSTEPDPFPTVVLEAMAAGRPVVAFRHGGVCEMVEEGVTGLLCPPGDLDALAQAIDSLLMDPDRRKRMGEAGQARLQRLFTREAFVARFSKLYTELAAAT